MHTMEHETAIVADIVREAAEEGSTGQEVARRIEQNADELRQAYFQQIVAPDAAGSSTDGQPDWMEKMPEGMENGSVDISAVSDIAKETAQDIRTVVGATSTETMEDDTAGFAFQGEQGSSVIDITSTIRPEDGEVIDVSMLSDIVKHEEEHEQQAPEWTAESVDIGASQELTRTHISEVASMSVQDSIDWVSDEYKGYYEFVTGLGIDAKEAREVARTGDLAGLGKRIREEQDKEDDAVEASMAMRG